jgi:hypothetical protein
VAADHGRSAAAVVADSHCGCCWCWRCCWVADWVDDDDDDGDGDGYYSVAGDFFAW